MKLNQFTLHFAFLVSLIACTYPVDAFQGLVDFYDCTGKLDGNYVHPFDCGKFIACVAGTYAYELDCFEGLHYDPVTDRCDWPEVAGCTPAVTTPAVTSTTTTTQPSTTVTTRATTTGTTGPTPTTVTTTVTTPQPSTTVTTTASTRPTQSSTAVPSTTTEGVTQTSTAVTTQSTTPNPPIYFNCSGLPDGNYKHPTDCSKFISCVAEQYFYEMDCPEGLHYDPSSNRCDYPEIAGCDSSTVTPTPDPDACDHDCEYVGIDCHRYYTCVNFTRKEFHECSKDMGLAFNPDLKVCDRIENVRGCGDETTELPTTPEPDCGCKYVANEDDCSRYFFCPDACENSSIPCEPRRCPGDLLWSIDAYGDGSFHQQCTVPSIASCASNRSGSPQLEFSCHGRENGLYRNEKDCRSYWKCNGGMALLYDCPEDFIYNPEIKVCDFKGKSMRFCNNKE